MTRVERINTDFSQQPFRGKHNAKTRISGISVIPIEHTEARSIRTEACLPAAGISKIKKAMINVYQLLLIHLIPNSNINLKIEPRWNHVQTGQSLIFMMIWGMNYTVPIGIGIGTADIVCLDFNPGDGRYAGDDFKIM